MGSRSDFKKALRGMRSVTENINSMASAMTSFNRNLRDLAGTVTATPRVEVTATPQFTTTLTVTYSLGTGVSSSASGSAGVSSSGSGGSAPNGT